MSQTQTFLLGALVLCAQVQPVEAAGNLGNVLAGLIGSCKFFFDGSSLKFFATVLGIIGVCAFIGYRARSNNTDSAASASDDV